MNRSKIIVFALSSILIAISGCKTFDPVVESYGVPSSEDARSRVYVVGHKNVFPNDGVLLRLVMIDANSNNVDRYTVKAYDLASGSHVLHYQLRDFSNATDKYCSTGMGGGVAYCGTSGEVTSEHPYKLEAILKPNFVYVARPPQEGGKNEICLYGEPIGVVGQKAVEHSGILLLSASATEISCGAPDMSVTYKPGK